jgi:hypothetical protein
MPPTQRNTDKAAEVSSTPDETTAAWSPPTLSECPASLPDRVPARWLDAQAVFNREQGLICYGDPIWVSAEQLADDPRLTAWADGWTPDPAVLAASQLEG